jgi:hypothetical protein
MVLTKIVSAIRVLVRSTSTVGRAAAAPKAASPFKGGVSSRRLPGGFISVSEARLARMQIHPKVHHWPKKGLTGKRAAR